MATRNLIVALTSTARGFSQGFDKARREVGSFDVTVRKTSQGSLSQFSSRVSAISTSLGGLAAAAGGAVVLQKVGQFAQDSVKSFSDLEESINAVNVTFEEGADKILEFGQNSARSVGLATSQLNQAVIPIGALFRNFGFEADEAADSAIELTQRAADLASVFNTDVNDALGAIGSALRGEQEPLRRFGADISAARVEAFLLSEGIVSSKSEIDEAAKVFGRYQLILQDTARAAGDFQNTSDSFANRQRIVAAEFENLQARVGEALLPLFESFIDFGPTAIEAIDSLIPAISGAVDAAKPLVDTFGDLAGAASDLLGLLGPVAQGFADLREQSDQFLSGELTGFDEIEGFLATLTSKGALPFALEQLGRLEELLRGPQVGDSGWIRILDTFDNRLESGTDGVKAFRDAVEGAVSNGYELADALDQIIDRSGLEGEDLIAGLDAIRRNENLNLTTQDLQALAAAYVAAVNAEEGFTRRRPRGRGGVPEIPQSTIDAAKAAADSVGGELYDAYIIAERSAWELDEASLSLLKTWEDQAAAAEAAADEAANLAARWVSSVDDIEDANDDGKLSTQEYLDSLTGSISDLQLFYDSLAVLTAAGLDRVVQLFRDKGPSSAQDVAAFADNLGDAYELEELLEQETSLAIATAIQPFQKPESFATTLQSFGASLARFIEAGFSELDLISTVADQVDRAGNQGQVGSSGVRGAPVGAFASGGIIQRGQLGLVGEKGPEFIRPLQTSRIYPNGTMPSMGGPTVEQHLHFNFPNPQPVEDIQRGVLLAGIARTAEVARI